jgi:choline dehydrogenase
MLPGIGDESKLRPHGIPVIQYLPDVGRNLQNHIAFGCIWEYRQPIATRSGSEATLDWKTDPSLDSSDLPFCQIELLVPSAKTAHSGIPPHGRTVFAGLVT